MVWSCALLVQRHDGSNAPNESSWLAVRSGQGPTVLDLWYLCRAAYLTAAPCFPVDFPCMDAFAADNAGRISLRRWLVPSSFKSSRSSASLNH